MITIIFKIKDLNPSPRHDTTPLIFQTAAIVEQRKKELRHCGGDFYSM
jgi:hypothetical protein